MKNTQQQQHDSTFCSGHGAYHTNHPDAKKRKPYVPVTYQDICEMAVSPPSVAKEDAQWAIFSTYMGELGRNHAYQRENGLYGCLWFDSDAGNHQKDAITAVLNTIGCDYLIYSTRSAKPDEKKWRVIIPLAKLVAGADYVLYQEILNDTFEAVGIEPDRSSQRAGQPCYLPNEGEYFEMDIADLFDGFDVAKEWAQALKDKQQQEEIEKQARIERKAVSLLKAQQRATSGAVSPIDAYNESHAVEDMLIHYGYTQVGVDRYLSPNSDSGSAGVIVKDGKWFSNHASDIGIGNEDVNGKAFGDAADLWLHYEGGDIAALSDMVRGGVDVEFDALDIHPLANFIDFDINNIPPTEFVLDGMIQAGVVLIAGAAGVGKTTQVVPLAARLTHLIDDGIKPLLRRNVIYISEDPKQVMRVLKSMDNAKLFDDVGKLNDRFKLVAAQRLDADKIIKVVDDYVKLSIDNDGFNAMPLVVFDTANASFDLENESDNAEVGKVIAALKQSFGDIPVWIVAHTAKAIKRSDVREFSARGAGAWEGDVNQVLYLCIDEDDNTRYLAITEAKHRFCAVADGISFSYVESWLSTRDVLGNVIIETLMHGDPTVVNAGQRKAHKAKQKAEREAKEHEDLKDEIVVLVGGMDEGGGVNRSDIAKGVKHTKAKVVLATGSLIAEGRLIELDMKGQAKPVKLPFDENENQNDRAEKCDI